MNLSKVQFEKIKIYIIYLLFMLYVLLSTNIDTNVN